MKFNKLLVLNSDFIDKIGGHTYAKHPEKFRKRKKKKR